MALCVTLGYFSSMELLQAFTYTVINECDNPANQIMTLLGYLHIAFQPFFINFISMYFIPAHVREKIQIPVYILCFATAIFMIIVLYPLPAFGKCQVGSLLCGIHLCSVSGNWHIAWELSLNSFSSVLIKYFGINHLPYFISALVFPFLYGAWRFTLYHALVGPILANLLTNNSNEMPAVWCLLSIGICLLVVKTRLRNIMHVKSWPLWPKSWQKTPVLLKVPL